MQVDFRILDAHVRKKENYIMPLKKYFLVFFLVLVACFAASPAPPEAGQKAASLEKKTGSCTFAILGDNRSGDDTYTKIIRLAMERRPDFMINVGDQISRPGSLSGWARFWELSSQVNVPYFLTVGNHDAGNKKSEEIYREQVDHPGNELYYSFPCGDSLFIILDSHMAGQEKRITGGQFSWLEGLLETSAKKRKFVFLHHPLFSDRVLFARNLDSHPGERDRLQQLLVKHRVTAVFAGHLHLYQRNTFDGITNIITGGAGAPLIADDENGGFFHFVLVTVKNGSVDGEVIDINGKVRDRFSLNGKGK